MSGCGLVVVLGPKGSKKSLHVFMGGKTTCCCGALTSPEART